MIDSNLFSYYLSIFFLLRKYISPTLFHSGFQFWSRRERSWEEICRKRDASSRQMQIPSVKPLLRPQLPPPRLWPQRSLLLLRFSSRAISHRPLSSLSHFCSLSCLRRLCHASFHSLLPTPSNPSPPPAPPPMTGSPSALTGGAPPRIRSPRGEKPAAAGFLSR